VDSQTIAVSGVADLVSVVIPAYNEEKNIRKMYEAVRASLRGLNAVEIIFIDDGSKDATAERVRQLSGSDDCVRLVRFGRNFGHQAALLAGLQTARGAAVITLDCDLQHPPEQIPRMLAAWKGGAKVVQMVRLHTVEGGLKSLSSKTFYRVLNLLSETPVTAAAADFQLLDRAAVDALLQFKDRYPFLRGLISWLGFPTVCLEYTARERSAGKSGYTYYKMIGLSVRALTGSSSQPLRFSFYLGVLTAMVSLAYAVFALFAAAFGRTIQGWTSVIVVITFLGAVQLISTGIVGEYVARIYEQSRGVPRYVIVEGAPSPDHAEPKSPTRLAKSSAEEGRG
jgi:glycosyltransferase involved in cell wall biosynthesis